MTVPTAKTARQRGLANRRRGADCERRLAQYLTAWWPDAVRAIRATNPDPGDVANTSPGLWWSAKDCEVERYPAWFTEMAEKAHGRIGLLVVRRRGYADPGDWWCWILLPDLRDLLGAASDVADVPVRMTLRDVLPLLTAAGYTHGDTR